MFCSSSRRLSGLDARVRSPLPAIRTTPPTNSSGVHRLDAGPVEALNQAGFACVRLPQGDCALCEAAEAVLAFGECLEVGEQCDGGVVLGRFQGGDEGVDARPRGVFLAGQVVESSFAGHGARLLAPRLVFGALSGEPTLTVGSPACGVVEQIGNGAGGWGRDGRGVLSPEAAQHLHSYPRGLTLDDPSQQPVLLGDR